MPTNAVVLCCAALETNRGEAQLAFFVLWLPLYPDPHPKASLKSDQPLQSADLPLRRRTRRSSSLTPSTAIPPPVASHQPAS